MIYGVNLAGRRVSSPRVRGCSVPAEGAKTGKAVLPAYAGVFLAPHPSRVPSTCLPRVCGGVPSARAHIKKRKASSPRVRGCSLERLLAAGLRDRLPRVCGGVPSPYGLTPVMMLSSPRVRGCSRPRHRPRGPHERLPRVCGGVPQPVASYENTEMSSPRVRGCSFAADHAAREADVFPACAGVFLRSDSAKRPPSWSSSCTRGCSGPEAGEEALPVFLACAGVFPRRPMTACWRSSLPRICGSGHRASTSAPTSLCSAAISDFSTRRLPASTPGNCAS